MVNIKIGTTKKRTASNRGRIEFPRVVLEPVAKFLRSQLSRLERRKSEVEEDDPFSDLSRINDNASPDADAAEQFGHARASAVKTELERTIIQTRKALTRVKIGKYGICENCGNMIDTDRLMIYPEATLCISCERKREK